jgi:hypothetical protein
MNFSYLFLVPRDIKLNLFAIFTQICAQTVPWRKNPVKLLLHARTIDRRKNVTIIRVSFPARKQSIQKCPVTNVIPRFLTLNYNSDLLECLERLSRNSFIHVPPTDDVNEGDIYAPLALDSFPCFSMDDNQQILLKASAILYHKKY